MGSHLTVDPDRLAVIRTCMEAYDVGSPDDDWPNNIISRHTVVYYDGTITLAGNPAIHVVDDVELALCRSLSAEAAVLMAGVSVGMGSEADEAFQDFFVTAPVGSHCAVTIDEALIRRCFGGVLFPPATITVEPFSEDTIWWGEVAEDGADSDPSYFEPWRAMVAWFRQQSAFRATAFVRVGDAQELGQLPEESYPRGTVIPGCVLPRLALGLTPKGSLAGLFGHVVQT